MSGYTIRAWLYIKCVVIHIYLYSDIPLYHMQLYKWLYIMVYSYSHNSHMSYTRIPSFRT